jgi:hypothetical protein
LKPIGGKLACDMDKERRQKTRASPKAEEIFEVAIRRARGEVFTGEVTDFTPEGLGVRFPRRANFGELHDRELVDLTVQAPHLRHPIQVRARVMSVRQSECEQHYGFRLLTRHVAGLGGVHKVFNRRSSYRVEPNPAAPPIEVRVRAVAAPQKIHKVRLKTISPMSLSVIGPTILDLGGDGHVELSFELPTSSRTVQLRGRVGRRAFERTGVQQVVTFDPEHSEDFSQNQAEVMDYVLFRYEQSSA